jgi:Stage II sporulation protein E (SpoIIE)
VVNFAAVDLVDQPGRVPSRRVAVAARDAGDEVLLRDLGAVRAYAPGSASDTGRVLDGGGSVLIPELSERGAERHPDDDPVAGSVLDRCDQLVQGLEMAAMATAVYARLDPPDPDGTRTLHYANAGHPTPLLLILAACLPDPLRDDVALLAVRLNS